MTKNDIVLLLVYSCFDFVVGDRMFYFDVAVWNPRCMFCVISQQKMGKHVGTGDDAWKWGRYML